MFVSIIIPTYNRIPYLEMALDAVLIQTYTQFECIIVNDYPQVRGELDKLIAARYDYRFKVIHNSRSMGVSRARNKAIKQAKGEIIAFLDDDDIWAVDYLEQHVQQHVQNPEAGVVFCGYTEFWDDGLLREKEVNALLPDMPINEAMVQNKFHIGCCSTVTVKTPCFDVCGVFDTSLSSYEDWDLWIRLSLEFDFVPIHGAIVRYRHHLGDRGSSNLDKKLNGLEIILKRWMPASEYDTLLQQLRWNAYFLDIRQKVLVGETRGKALSSFGKLLGNTNIFRGNEFVFSMYALLMIIAGKRWYPVIQKSL